MTEEDAEGVAIGALAWLAGNDELLKVFLGSTGLDPADLRALAADPHLLASVLDFLLLDDGWLTRFAAETGIPPEDPMCARSRLPGGDLPNWT